MQGARGALGGDIMLLKAGAVQDGEQGQGGGVERELGAQGGRLQRRRQRRAAPTRLRRGQPPVGARPSPGQARGPGAGPRTGAPCAGPAAASGGAQKHCSAMLA